MLVCRAYLLTGTPPVSVFALTSSLSFHEWTAPSLPPFVGITYPCPLSTAFVFCESPLILLFYFLPWVMSSYVLLPSFGSLGSLFFGFFSSDDMRSPPSPLRLRPLVDLFFHYQDPLFFVFVVFSRSPYFLAKTPLFAR